MGMPSNKELKAARKRLEKVEGTLSLPAKPTPLEQFRWDICQKFIGYKLDHKISQKDMSEMLGVDEAKISKILHHRIDEFSTDRLISLYAILVPKLKLKVG